MNLYFGTKRSLLPGFGPTLGYTVLYLSLIVLIPLSTVVLKASSLTWIRFWEIVTAPRALASYRLSFGASLSGALIAPVLRPIPDLKRNAPSIRRVEDRLRGGARLVLHQLIVIADAQQQQATWDEPFAHTGRR